MPRDASPVDPAPDELSRRDFLEQTPAAALAAGAVLTGAIAASPQAEAHFAEAASLDGTAFHSDWGKTPDRVWLGADFWANPLQDWRVSDGRIECGRAAPSRHVHLLTREVTEHPGRLEMRVRIGRLDGGTLAAGGGSAGFRFGIRGELPDYRYRLIYGQGIDAGFTSEGKLFLGAAASGVPVDLNRQQVELVLELAAQGDRRQATLIARDEMGRELARVSREGLLPAQVAGGVALVANFFGSAVAGKAGKGKAKKGADSAAAATSGQFWFADWHLEGDMVSRHDERAFGPILFCQYTVSQAVLKLTAQMPPLGPQDTPVAELWLARDGEWKLADRAAIHPQARTVTFRIQPYAADRDVPYEVRYALRSRDGASMTHAFGGTIRRDPVDQPVITVADISCNTHEAFPNADYTAKVLRLDPDLVAFVGDQFYESSGGYGVQRSPLEMAILDYLRKWYLHGWTWRDVIRDRPSISIPDDHDVYQGNNWGEGGAPQRGTQEQGGYNMPPQWVNVVHHTQTSHHPDPWDATPCQQGISVYSGPLVYGGISFAILADRQFKSGPEGKVPPTGGRGDHVTDPNFDPKSADLPGLQLLGERQMKHLAEWVTDWRGAEMKAVISQTIFTAMATHHGNEGRLVADYDTNGWPQSERNAALRLIRKAFAFHIAGDQHLPAVIHYGIQTHRDAGLAFAGPAVNVGYPRWFEPSVPGANRAPGAPENTGDFRDSFGHPLTVLAVANGSHQPRTRVLEKLHDKASGLGLVRFDKVRRQITIECWPLLADPSQPHTQFPGWPVTCTQLDNYGQKAAAQLPRLVVEGLPRPVVEVYEEPSGELVYALRLRETQWQPHVFAPGTYRVVVRDADFPRRRVELRGLTAAAENREVRTVTF
jgi:alkaline phosphatase D